MVTVERMTDPARFRVLARECDELIDDQSPGAIFRSSAWLIPWWQCFSRRKELSVYVAREGPRLLGVLPAYREPSPLGGRRLRLVGDRPGASNYLGVIGRPGLLDRAVHPIALAIRADERDVLLAGLAVDDPLISALKGGRESISIEHEACPYLTIDGRRDFEAWIRDRPPGVANQLRRRKRWLERRPGFHIDILTHEDEIAAALPAFWKLHRARWSVNGLSKVQRLPEFEQFHAESARALARRGWVRLYILYAEGAPRAALYGFERGKRFLYYQSGRDPDWSQRSVGTVILCAALQDAFERDLTEFDFSRGAQSYKSLYASSHRGIVNFRAAAGPRARALALSDRACQLVLPLGGALPHSLRRRLRTWPAAIRP